MNPIYTTIELIRILDTEGETYLRGERLSLLSTAPTGHAVVDYFLKSDGIQKYTAYQDFKATIHAYQRQHQVSGLVWRELVVRGQSLHYPEVDPRLVTLPADVLILQLHKPRILDYWQRVTASMDLYLASDRGTHYLPLEPAAVGAMADKAQWAQLQAWERAEFLEVVLQLGWGAPEAAAHWRNRPEAGSDYIHGVRPGQRPIC
ncbi:hypothetical protein [Prochlorothrix hollandica]|uniref:hypothetical protein n=1 Tax=Prochlorothrix hollandica TaxID=1223 RepID=UPI0033408C28